MFPAVATEHTSSGTKHTSTEYTDFDKVLHVILARFFLLQNRNPHSSKDSGQIKKKINMFQVCNTRDFKTYLVKVMLGKGTLTIPKEGTYKLGGPRKVSLYEMPFRL